MLINTLVYIAAFHFSPTNTALTLSVPRLSAAEVMTILTSAIQSPPPNPTPLFQKEKKANHIGENGSE